MRRVIVEKKYGSASADVGTEGLLLMWGTEADDGGTNTVAIIERDDGMVVYAAPYAIRFLEPSVVAAKLAATPANIARACGMENEVEEAQEVSETNPPKGWRLAVEHDMICETSIQFQTGFDGVGRWIPVPSRDFGEFFAGDWNGIPAVKIEVAP